VGATETIKADVRIIAATHINLEDAVAGRKFREDLYYRLNVVSLHLPSLRERKEDIPALAEHFLEKTAIELGSTRKSLTPKALQRLADYEWPGNVRELENCIKRAVVLSSSNALLPEDVEVQMKGEKESSRVMEGMTLDSILEDRIHGYMKKTKKFGEGNIYGQVVALVEKPLITCALKETNYNQLKAAELLGINRNTLRKKISELSISNKKSLDK
jgi:two-component system, NtrC family, nitrogen regulation response regulator GlnG